MDGMQLERRRRLLRAHGDERIEKKKRLLAEICLMGDVHEA